MNPRPASVIILGGALLAACAAIYLWGPLAALVAAACGAAGFAAARLAGERPPKRAPEGLADAFPLHSVGALGGARGDGGDGGRGGRGAGGRAAGSDDGQHARGRAGDRQRDARGGVEPFGARHLRDGRRGRAPAAAAERGDALSGGLLGVRGGGRARRARRGQVRGGARGRRAARLRPARRAAPAAGGRLRQRRARRGRRLLRHHAARTTRTRPAGVPLERLARAADASDRHHHLRRDARRRRGR